MSEGGNLFILPRSRHDSNAFLFSKLSRVFQSGILDSRDMRKKQFSRSFPLCLLCSLLHLEYYELVLFINY